MFVITDERIDTSALSALNEEGFESILLPPADYLSEAVAGHTDMLIFMGFGRLFCHRHYYDSNIELIDSICKLSGNALTLSDEPIGEKYPLDVLFNACLIGNALLCNTKTVSRLIYNTAIENGYRIIDVPQGYTKCSVCAVSNMALITADVAIASACQSEFDVLLISEGHISLPPYDYGFIGGTSGVFGQNVYFCGSLDTHPDGEKIKDFCCKHHKNVVSLSDGILQDVGSLFFI